MNNLCVLFISSIALCVQGLSEPRIVGGDDAPEGKYPYQVSLRFNGRHFCGGSIISKQYILTAGHCVQGKPINNIRVHVGTNSLTKEGDKYEPIGAVTLAYYEGNTIQDDVALIKVSRGIKFSQKVKPIPLASFNTVPGTTAVASGWGRLWNDGDVPLALQHINLTVISNKDCKRYYDKVKSNNICTFTKRGEGVCKGDSGSPLVSNGTQIGIVSYGTICASGYPDVYAKVAAFGSWIHSNIDSGYPNQNKTDTNPDKDRNKNNGGSINFTFAPFSIILCVVVTLNASW